MKRLLPALLLLPLAALAGPYDQPWVVIATDTKPSSDPNLKPAPLSRVDGDFTYRNQAVTTPGPHMVTVALPPREGFKVGTQETFDIQTSPCMRYHVAARLDAGSQQWKPLVRYSELIGECATKFKTDAGAK